MGLTMAVYSQLVTLGPSPQCLPSIFRPMNSEALAFSDCCFMWGFHVSLVSNMMPRYLNVSTYSIDFRLMFNRFSVVLVLRIALRIALRILLRIVLRIVLRMGRLYYDWDLPRIPSGRGQSIWPPY